MIVIRMLLDAVSYGASSTVGTEYAGGTMLCLCTHEKSCEYTGQLFWSGRQNICLKYLREERKYAYMSRGWFSGYWSLSLMAVREPKFCAHGWVAL